MTTRNEKRKILLTKEQEQRMADQAADAIQRYTNELAQVQGRRCELFATLLAAALTGRPSSSVSKEEVADIHRIATEAMRLDTVQKWEGLRDLFKEMDYHGPQPHLEWAAKQVGVILFEEKPPMLVGLGTPEELSKVIQ